MNWNDGQIYEFACHEGRPRAAEHHAQRVQIAEQHGEPGQR